VLLVMQDAEPGALHTLLAGGGADFVDASAAPGEFRVRVERLLGRIEPLRVAGVLPELPDLIGHSPAFAEQVARLPMVAQYEVSVLLLGETGTGKEVFAHAAHYLSARAAQPWVAVNCGAIPADLVEDELFGHVRGAYTHAHAARPGLIREAEGGTLFLDEIDSLPYSAQVKLLRFLQDKQYRPVGSNAVCRADVRVFAASNRELGRLAAEGSFRQDLYFRLNVIMLRLPPLRDRVADIAPLAQHFLRAAARQWQRPPATLSAAAHGKLMAHSWPGNVRELKNVIDRAMMLGSGGVLGAQDIDLDDERASAAPAPLCTSLRAAKGRLVEDFERAYVERVLAESGGNVTLAARAAQKNRRAFFELMRKYRIEPERYRAGAAAAC
jgi:DNA-binding NtrC family response regulator